MLARLGTLEATGIYGAAYRLIDVSFAPVASLLTAAYAVFSGLVPVAFPERFNTPNHCSGALSLMPLLSVYRC